MKLEASRKFLIALAASQRNIKFLKELFYNLALLVFSTAVNIYLPRPLSLLLQGFFLNM